MSVTIEADSPQAQQLETLVKEKMTAIGVDEDIDFVAQYIVLMVTNGKEKSAVSEELGGLFGNKFSDDFLNWLFQTANTIANGGSVTDNGNASNAGGKIQPFTPSSFNQNQSHDFNPIPNTISPNASAFAPNHSTFTPNHSTFTPNHDQYDPSSHSLNGRFNPRPSPGGFKPFNGGISKSHNIRGRGGFKRTNDRSNFINNLDLSAMGAMGTGAIANGNGYENTFRPSRPKFMERCKNWPGCTNSPCDYLHPTRPCQLYPNCPKPVGTCRFVHLGEDNSPPQGFKFDLPSPEILEKLKAQHLQFLEHQQTIKSAVEAREPRPPRQPLFVICHYSSRCLNKSCACAHPTPANDNAKITGSEWCQAGKDCTDASCEKAHPSGSLVRTPAPLAPPEPSLEACKFGKYCTNPTCRFRHAVSPIVCRDGGECKRADCIFTHPLAEQCKFGVNCKRPGCLYQHPEGVRNTSSVWVKDKPSISERQFAEPEDQVMETVIPGSEQQGAPTEQAAN